MNRIAKDPLQRKLEIANWIILAILFIPSFLFAPTKFCLGVLLGGFISILNFHGMEFGLRGLFRNPSGNVKRPTMIKYYIRLALTAVVLFFLISNVSHKEQPVQVYYQYCPPYANRNRNRADPCCFRGLNGIESSSCPRQHQPAVLP